MDKYLVYPPVEIESGVIQPVERYTPPVPFSDLEVITKLVNSYRAVCSALGVKPNDTVSEVTDLLARIAQCGASPEPP